MSAALRCKECHQDLPELALACPNCIAIRSNEAYRQHQYQFAPQIATDQVELTLVYVAAGNGYITPLWHLQRIGDNRHAYCGESLAAGRRQDHLYFSKFHQVKNFCKGCDSELDRVLNSAEAK